MELRPPDAILATLDGDGALDGLPFMPEMLGYFGRSYSVAARVERACDTIDSYLARRMPDTVLLDDLRCDGGGHGGCQAACRLYWKEAWLQRVRSGSDAAQSPRTMRFGRCAIWRFKTLADRNRSVESRPTYRCQATEFVRAYRAARMVGREVVSARGLLSQRLARNLRPCHVAPRPRRVSTPAGAKVVPSIRAVVGVERVQRAARTEARGHGARAPRSTRSPRRSMETANSAGCGSIGRCSRTAGRPRRVKTQVKRFVDERYRGDG